LPDADGDGVTDQFDLEPNTPAGAAVDTHGRALDTDGDGVPDYRDKEKLTPQSCFPVNADGVGTCPEPACCTELRKKIEEDEENGKARRTNCNLTSLPSVTFKAGSYKLSKDAQAILVTAATQLKANATCNVKVVGYVTDASKKAQQLSWDRVNSVIKYLVEQQGIAESRIIFSYDTTGSSNSVDLLPTTETGPNTVPAPALHLRSNK
jgi:outer membrane protein OmpA-like peptidoglycan-associated protein